jgi:hypothetical protein
MKRLDEIWQLQVFFDNGCDTKYWMFEDIAFPLAVLKYKMDDVLYSDYNEYQGSGTPHYTYDDIQHDAKRTYQEAIVLPRYKRSYGKQHLVFCICEDRVRARESFDLGST